MKPLNIFYRDGTTEHFKCKNENKASAIISRRGSIRYAEYNGRVIHGKKPAKPIEPNEMALEELEKYIQRLG